MSAADSAPGLEVEGNAPHEAAVACVDERAGLLLGFPAPVKPEDQRAHERIGPQHKLG